MFRPFHILFLLATLTWAQPSSIDTFPLPREASRRFDLQVHQQTDPENPVWYHRYTFYLEGESRVKHGLEVERERLRDRERHATDFKETRRVYENGEAMEHFVVTLYQTGVIRERAYNAGPQITLTTEFNESGQEILLPGRTARGAQRKRERITSQFDTVFDLN